jgi:LAO/AO transport system kinase
VDGSDDHSGARSRFREIQTQGAVSVTNLAERIIDGDIRALARAASWIEERRPEAESLLRELFPRTGRALILGVTGAPGAGKSSLCDQVVRLLRAEGKTVAVIAVDPSSPYTGGAILGDRIRMQRHHADQGVFIRSMATRGWLGGLARATTEMTMLFDAAGRDVVIVETVGVGQDEVEIARLAGVTLVVLVPGMGDDVQAIKAGIIEIADVFVINKSELPGAEKLERELNNYLGLSHRPDGWTPKIVHTVATDAKGITEALEAAREYQAQSGGASHLAEIWSHRLREMLRERFLDRLPEAELLAAGREVAEKRRDPYSILNDWLTRL